MERYFIIYANIGGKHHSFYIMAEDLQEAKCKAAKAAYNYFNFLLEDAAIRIKEVSEEEYNSYE